MSRWTNRSIEQSRNRLTTYTYGQVISDKGTKAVQWRKVVFSTDDTGTIRYLHTPIKMWVKD